MRSIVALLAIVLVLFLVVPTAQAQYAGRPRSHFEYAVSNLHPTFDYPLADLDRRLCQNHRGTGDRVEMSRCYGYETNTRGQVTGFHIPMWQRSRMAYDGYDDSSYYSGGYGYRDGRYGSQRGHGGAVNIIGAIGSIWNAVEARRANNKLDELNRKIDQQQLMEEAPPQYQNQPTRTTREIWINRGRCAIQLRDEDDPPDQWLTRKTGQAAELEDGSTARCRVLDARYRCQLKFVRPGTYHVYQVRRRSQ